MILFRRGLRAWSGEKACLCWDVLGYGKWVLWQDQIEAVGRQVGRLSAAQLWHRFRGRIAEKVRADGMVRGWGWVQEKCGGLEKVIC